LGLALLFASAPVPMAADDAPRKEGDWQVTQIGKARDCWISKPFSKQNRLLIALDQQPPQLWDTECGKRVALLQGLKGIDSCDVSPDGTRLLTADRMGGWRNNGFPDGNPVIRSLRLWNMSTGKLVKTIDVDLSDNDTCTAYDWQVCWLEPHKILVQLNWRGNRARASFRTVLLLVDPETGLVKKKSAVLEVGESLILSPDRKRSVSGLLYGVQREDDGGTSWGGLGTTVEVDLIDMEEFHLVRRLEEGEGDQDERRTIVGRVWSSDSRRVATVGSDHTIRVWDGKRGSWLCAMEGHRKWILSACFSPDGRTLLTASNDGTARLWDVDSGEELLRLDGHTAELNVGVFDARGACVLTAAEDRTARLWDAATGRLLRVWAGHDSPVRHATFAASGSEVETHTARGVRRRWSVADGSLLEEGRAEGERTNRYGRLFLKATGKGLEVWSGPAGAPGEVE
jgi:WD40 repeat protein